MAKRLQLRRGTTAQTNAFTGAVGEVTVDTDKKTVVVHDGTTVGGTVLAKVSEVPSLVPQATELVVGASKIATTAIAQAGSNDTDFITAKKLRDVLGIDTQARVNLQTLNQVYQKNIRSITLVSTGVYEVNLLVPMGSTNYSTVGETITSTNGHANTILKLDPTFAKTTSKFRLNVVSCGNGALFGVTGDIFFKVIENV